MHDSPQTSSPPAAKRRSFLLGKTARLMEKVAYKQFYIIVRVKPDDMAKNRFQVFCEIRPVQDETQLLRACAIVAEFANEKAAYEHGLLQCKGWIDEHKQDG